MRSLLILLIGLGMSSSLWAQSKTTLSGYVRDASSGESMIGATIFIPELGAGTYSNEYGFYSLTVKPGDYQVQYRFVGFEPDTIAISLQDNVSQNVELNPTGTTIATVEISSKAADENVSSTEMGVSTLSD